MLFSTVFLGLSMASFSLSSSNFKSQESIPKDYTCVGLNISPELSWDKPPENTKSFALAVVDPDAPNGNFIHWVFYNIPSTVRALPTKMGNLPLLPDGSMQGVNGFGFVGYGGPCPPQSQKHSYIFTLYALDSMLALEPGISYTQLQSSIKGHILAEAKLVGYFGK